MDLIDSHAHLDMLADLPGALARAVEAGVGQIVTIGIDLASSQKAAALSKRNPGVFHTVGLHPHDAAQADEAYWQEMAALARRSGARAMGECGLDFYRDRSPRPAQREAFARQVELALELGLPLVVHDRDAHQEVLDLLKEQDAGRVGGVVHCFSGDWPVARTALDLGFHLGIVGTITYKNNQPLRDLVARVPLSRILVETDCPFLAPVPKRGKPNEPAFVAYTAAELARCLGRDPAQVARATSANARRLLRLPEPA